MSGPNVHLLQKKLNKVSLTDGKNVCRYRFLNERVIRKE